MSCSHCGMSCACGANETIKELEAKLTDGGVYVDASDYQRLKAENAKLRERIDELEATITRTEDVYHCAKAMGGGHGRETQKLKEALGAALEGRAYD